MDLKELRNKAFHKVFGVHIYDTELTLEKYRENIADFDDRMEFFGQCVPFETVKKHHNSLMKTGINELWTLACGGAGNAYSTAAQLGVGNATLAAGSSQTDLQSGTTVQWNAMEVAYPTYGTDEKATFKASFASSEANFDWNEWGIRNDSTSLVLLNRKVEALGTKAAGTWVLTVEISLS